MERLGAWVEVDLDAFASNFRAVQAIVGDRTRIHVLVKADAYGHGAPEIARVAESLGAHSVGVATLDEGVELRVHGVRLPVLILSPTLASEAARIVEHALSPTVGNLESARSLADAAKARGVEVPVHIEIDTGMGRSGIASHDAAEFCAAVAALSGLRLAGLFTHFPSADAPAAQTGVDGQIEAFLAVARALRAAGVDPGLLHAANSAGILKHPASHLDLVRPGILLYGVPPSDTLPVPREFRPVMRFVTRLVHLREMPAGHPISYGGEFVTPEAMLVGTGAVGYGHGYPFALSGRGEALLRGKRVPILGRVTMDTTVFDLRGVPDAQIGDEIVLFGRSGSDEIHASDLAALCGTIVYEILTGIERRVPRVYIRDGRTVGTRTLLGHQSVEGGVRG